MFSLAIQPVVNGVFSGSSFSCQAPSCRSLKAACFINPSTNLMQKSKPISRTRRLVTAFAAPEALAEEAPAHAEEELIPTQEIETAAVVTKKVRKPRLVLKFVWMEKNIGLALDQVLPGYGTVPLSPYYFWPRKDAWEELKATLESKPWISQKKMIILLNQATDIINLWQQSGGNLTA